MKALNVIGIILAWILSICLVLWLVVTPMVLSGLSFLEPETITKVVSSTLTGGAQSPSSSAKEDFVPVSAGMEGAQLTLLADGDEAQQSGVASFINPDMVKDLFGVEVDAATLGKVLASDAVNDLLGAYTEDLTNVITGNGESTFNGETIKRIVNDNIDEIVEVVQEIAPELSTDELKTQIQTAVNENADKIVEALPKAEDLKNDLAGENPIVGILFAIMAKKDTIKAAFVGVAVALCVVIFFLRFPGLRGMRWLAVDLFVAGGIGAVICVVLKMVAPNALAHLSSEGGVAIAGLVGSVLSAFTGGLIWRFAVMLACGAVLLVGYILIKKFRNKKAAVEDAAEEPVVLEEPATVEEPVAEETEVVEQPVAEEIETV